MHLSVSLCYCSTLFLFRKHTIHIFQHPIHLLSHRHYAPVPLGLWGGDWNEYIHVWYMSRMSIMRYEEYLYCTQIGKPCQGMDTVECQWIYTYVIARNLIQIWLYNNTNGKLNRSTFAVIPFPSRQLFQEIILWSSRLLKLVVMSK